MSAFLGPIHTWLFNKIKLQDELTGALLNAFPDKREKAAAELDSFCGTLPEGELSDIIDGSNIHGWLNERIGVVEARLALACSILGDTEGAKKALCDAAYSFGAEKKIVGIETAEEAYKALNDRLLDGMPCDRVNEVKTMSDFVVIFEQVSDLHRPYWVSAEVEPELFYEIRTSWVRGMLEGSGVSYRKEGSCFYIEKE